MQGTTTRDISASKITSPLLIAIAVVGKLSTPKTGAKPGTNRWLFISPTIRRSAGGGAYYSRSKYYDLRQAQLEAGTGDAPLIGGQRPLLEPYEGKRKVTAAESAVKTGAQAPIGLPPR